MSEAIFPVLGAAALVVGVLPACALLAKLVLVTLERVRGPLHGLTLRYLVLTGSSVLPIAWFLSAGVHQAESGQSVLACLFDHESASFCFEPRLFVAVLATGIAAALSLVVRRGASSRTTRGASVDALRARIDSVLEAHPSCRALRGRVEITNEDGFAIGAVGWLRPRVLLGARFAESLSDTMLAGALAHERAHVASRDPLRYALLDLALALNPIGRALLAPHAARWHAAREAHCDRDAVLHGAAPLAVADAIVRAARPASWLRAALGARDASVLRLRVELLLAFAERPPTACCHAGPPALPLALFLLAFTLLLPHSAGTAALDFVHVAAERLHISLWN